MPTDNKLYLCFEYCEFDLKKYMKSQQYKLSAACIKVRHDRTAGQRAFGPAPSHRAARVGLGGERDRPLSPPLALSHPRSPRALRSRSPTRCSTA